MKYIIHLSLMAIFFLILSSSCRKEKIIEVEVEKEYSWELDDNFLHFNKIQLNSLATEDELYLMGRSVLSKVVPNQDDSLVFDIERSILSHNNSLVHRPTMTKDFFVGTGDYSVGFNSTISHLFDETNKWISVLAIDSSFARFDFPYYKTGESIIFNNSNQCLIPYLRYDTILSPSGVPFLLHDDTEFLMVQLSITEEPIYSVDTVYTTIVDKEFVFGALSSLHSFDEYFFVTSGVRVFRISPNLKIETVFTGNGFTGGLLKIFKHKEKLYGITTRELYQSDDDGLTWELLTAVDDDFWRLNFEIINNEVVGYGSSQLFHISILDNQLTGIEELENDGLTGNQITSISLFKEKVYVTTLSGVFTQNLDDFFSYK